MSLTTRFHESNPTDISQWTLVNPNDFNAKYKIYEKTMSTGEHCKIILKIVIKSIFTLGTLGIYYLIYLNCTKDGKADLENLKRRKIVHYVPNNMSDAAGNVDKYARNFHLVSPKDMVKHSQLLQRNELRDTQSPEIEIIKLSDKLKSCIKKVEDFSHLSDDIQKVLKTKKAYFLDRIYEKNVKLSNDSNTNLYDRLEEFLSLKADEQNTYNLIRLLSPFFNEVDVSAILKDAVNTARMSQHDKKTIYHRAFEEFREAFNKLNSKTDWLISIREKRDLFEFMHQLHEIGEEEYSPKFIHLYEKFKECYNECLASMEGLIQVDQEIKKQLEASFKIWEELAKHLQKNLAPEEKDYGVGYTLSDYLHDDLIRLGFNDEFQKAVASVDSNLNFSFIVLYFTGQPNRILNDIQNLLKDPKIEEAAKIECLKKIEKAKKDDAEILEKVEALDTKQNFDKMKKCFIENTDNNDTVDLLLGVEFFLKADYPDEKLDHEFFGFLKLLKNEFLIDGKAVCDKYFYLNFNAHFGHIDRYNTVLSDIITKTAL